MRNILVLFFALFLSASAFAGSQTEIVSFTTDKTSIESGEDFTIVIRIRNHGPDPATGLDLWFSPDLGFFFVLSSVAPAGWQCSSAHLNCRADSMAVGADVSLTYHVIAPALVRPASTILIAILNSTNSLQSHALLPPIELHASNRAADLSISVSAPPDPIARNTPLTLAYDVRNNGPQDLSDVRVLVHIPLESLTPVHEGTGWTCTPDAPVLTTCRRDFLAANANAPLSVRFTTPGVGMRIWASAYVFAAQAHLDQNESNDNAYRDLSIGAATDWSRILVPFTASEIRGANGSLWKTEISGIIESSTLPELSTNGCGRGESPCLPPPLNRLFDAAAEDLVHARIGAQFLYVGRADASKVKLATRVYDASKSDTTAGAFIPMARDEDFSTEGFSLIAIPVAPEFRSTLRLYDATGTDGRDVELALYGDAESEPFLRTTVTLRKIDGPGTATTALLPYYPASAQLDLSALIPSGYTRVRVSVRPALPTPQPHEPMQLWGFASITNNETSHVTVVAP
jgi:Domain of unknown function DUF11